MIKAVIIEDTDQAIQWLKSLLDPYKNEIEVIGDADNLQEAVRTITVLKPHVVFLDVQIKGGDGFDVIQAISTIDFKIIFTTSFDTFAVRAIRLSALDYLVKPIAKDEFDNAISRLLSDASESAQNKQIEVLVNNLRQVKKLALPAQNSIRFVDIENIIRCQADSNYTWFFLTNGNKLLVTKCLKEFEEMLEPSGFCRVHQSHLINLRYISEFKKESGEIGRAHV